MKPYLRLDVRINVESRNKTGSGLHGTSSFSTHKSRAVHTEQLLSENMMKGSSTEFVCCGDDVDDYDSSSSRRSKSGSSSSRSNRFNMA